MTNADLIIIVIMLFCTGPRAVMIHGVPEKSYNALQSHIIVLLTTRLFLIVLNHGLVCLAQP